MKLFAASLLGVVAFGEKEVHEYKCVDKWSYDNYDINVSDGSIVKNGEWQTAWTQDVPCDTSWSVEVGHKINGVS